MHNKLQESLSHPPNGPKVDGIGRQPMEPGSQDHKPRMGRQRSLPPFQGWKSRVDDHTVGSRPRRGAAAASRLEIGILVIPLVVAAGRMS